MRRYVFSGTSAAAVLSCCLGLVSCMPDGKVDLTALQAGADAGSSGDGLNAGSSGSFAGSGVAGSPSGSVGRAGSGASASAAGGGGSSVGPSMGAAGAAGRGRGGAGMSASMDAAGSMAAAGRGGMGGAGGMGGRGGAGGAAGASGRGAAGGASGASGMGGAGGMGGRSGAGGGSGMDGRGGAGGAAAAGGGGEATFDAVYEIITNQCNGCHGLGQGGLNTSTKDGAYDALVGVDSRSCAGQKRVVAGNPQSSVLFLAVDRTTNGNCNPPDMPIGGTKLDAASINTIRAWIQAGAPE